MTSEPPRPGADWRVRTPPPGARSDLPVHSIARVGGAGRVWAALLVGAGVTGFFALLIFGRQIWRRVTSDPVLLVVLGLVLLLPVAFAWLALRLSRDNVHELVADGEGVRRLGPNGWYLRWDQLAWIVPDRLVGIGTNIRFRLRDGVEPGVYQHTVRVDPGQADALRSLAAAHGVPARTTTPSDVDLPPIDPDAEVVSDVRVQSPGTVFLWIVPFQLFALLRPDDERWIAVPLLAFLVLAVFLLRGSRVRVIADTDGVRREGGLRPWSLPWSDVAAVRVTEQGSHADQYAVRWPRAARVETSELTIDGRDRRSRGVRIDLRTGADFVRLARAHGVQAPYHVRLDTEQDPKPPVGRAG